ncbi:hypothetical protein [uncultured Dietzia sp.]|uniref:hypothetical protein n=1 Tax=uncultured Dietzia sp. TaxID=395519 RepID=UPI0025F2C6EE|nr:hypothetical protein [uncultured Dietzia sp.]
MSCTPSARRRAAAGVALLTTLITALTLTACAADDPDGSTSSTATTTSSATAPTDTAVTATATIDGEPAAAAADSLREELVASLASSAAEFGDIEIDLLQLYPDHVSLIYVDPAEPDRRYRAEFRDSTWSDPTRGPRMGTAPPLPLDAIDPAVVRSAIEATPALLGTDEARLSHVSLYSDDSGRAEYLVALATGGSLGTVTFGPDGQEREVEAPR